MSDQPQSLPVKIDLPFDEAIRRVLKVKPEKKPAPKKKGAKKPR